jgi:hypothetical protein
MTTKKLRIGLLVDTRDLLAWESVMLEKIMNSYYAEIVLVVHNNTAPEEHPMDRRQEINSPLRKTPKSLFLRALRRVTHTLRAKLENKVGGCVPYAFAVINDLKQFRSIPRLDVTSMQKQFSADIDPVDIERIREFDVDVFIRLGFGVLSGDILNVAKYGIWSFLHADNRINRGGPAGFWEVFYNLPVTGSTLQILSENLDGGKVICRAFSATCSVSVKRNRNSLYWKASFQLPRKLEELYLVGADIFFENVERNNEYLSIYSNRSFTMPKLSEEIVLVFRMLWRIYSNRIRNFFVTSQWILLFEIRNEFAPSFFRFSKIIPPRDRSWADPHVLIKDQRYYVFIEEFPHNQNKGYISVMEMEEDGTHTMPQRVLEEPYHLSNPFVFEHGGQIFLIPESAKNRSVDLYRCVSFPDKWERWETLLKDVHAVDTTVHFYQGKWWLFTNIREHESGSSDDDLFLFYSDVLQRGHWKAHPRNPIVSDVTRARPAGNIFEHKGKLYRPAQDCSIRYGYGMRIQEILKMSESEYLEREVVFIEPKWEEKIIATHTFSKAGRLIFGDALEERWELFPALRRSA